MNNTKLSILFLSMISFLNIEVKASFFERHPYLCTVGGTLAVLTVGIYAKGWHNKKGFIQTAMDGASEIGDNYKVLTTTVLGTCFVGFVTHSQGKWQFDDLKNDRIFLLKCATPTLLALGYAWWTKP